MRYKDDRIDAGLIEILNQAVKAPKSLGENSSYYLVFDAPAGGTRVGMAGPFGSISDADDFAEWGSCWRQ